MHLEFLVDSLGSSVGIMPEEIVVFDPPSQQENGLPITSDSRLWLILKNWSEFDPQTREESDC